jgi:hypothetical protein
MPYCANCRTEVSAGDRFCRNCGQGHTTPETPTAQERTPLTLDSVPRWHGWLALPVGVLTSIIGLGLYSCWAYRRGRLDGMGSELNERPAQGIGWRIVGWGLFALIPFAGWYSIVHVPTLCYKHGLRIGAEREEAPHGFTSLPAFGAALMVPTAGILAAAFAVGIATGIIEEQDERPSTESGRPVSAPDVPIDRPLHSEATIMRLVAEAICPAAPTLVQTALADAITPLYVGNGIWRVQGRVTLQGQVYTATWEVDEVSGYVAPQNDAALVFHAAAEGGSRC